jgi:hypothetical protein
MNNAKKAPAPCLNCGFAWDIGINEDGLCHACVGEIRFTMAMTKLTAKRGAFVVVLASCGNIDFGQDPRRSLPGVPKKRLRVASLRDASEACRLYIKHYELGGGNWIGGQVHGRTGSEPVAQISYNGRAWKPGPYPQPEISLEQP